MTLTTCPLIGLVVIFLVFRQEPTTATAAISCVSGLFVNFDLDHPSSLPTQSLSCLTNITTIERRGLDLCNIDFNHHKLVSVWFENATCINGTIAMMRSPNLNR